MMTQSGRTQWLVTLVAAAAVAFSCTAPPTPPPSPPSREQPFVASVAVAEPDLDPQPAEAQPESSPAAPQPSAEFDVRGSVERAWHNRQQDTGPVKTMRLAVALKQKWNARVGKTTFRTTMALCENTIVIGTHGATLDGKNEKSDGVYLLDARSGQQTGLIRTPGAGDRDVGGVAVDGRRIYFTTDNGLIVATALDGKVAWQARARGKVRPAPALGELSGDGHVDVVVGDESGTLRAFNGKTGKRLWSVATGANDYGARGFIGAAAITDLNGDGADDVVAGARDGILTAYEGRTGRVLWQVGQSSGIHASPVVADFDHDGAPEILGAWSYGRVGVYDGRTGALRWATVLRRDDGGIEGLFGTPIPLSGRPGVLIAPTAWWGAEADGVIGVGVDRRVFKAFEGRVSSSAVVTDLDGDGVREAILGTEQGKVIALHADGGYAVLATLAGPIEAPAMLADVDADGTYELIVASNDSMLRCYETGSTAKPDISRFRGESPHNRGEIGKVSLGWSSAQAGTGQQPAASSRGKIRIDYLRCCRELTDAAKRAPSPQNEYLLRAAGVCNVMAADGRPREVALRRISRAARDAMLPDACR